MSAKLPIRLLAHMRFGNGEDRELKLDLTDLEWKAHGLENAAAIPPVMLDLIEIARTVHEFDRRQPKRTTSVRVESVEVDMPVREPERWNRPAARAALTELLRIQANVEWKFTFRRRRPGKASADVIFGSAKNKAPSTNAVILFSGGLDSTSGLATITANRGAQLLVSYYSQNLSKQREMASMLGFDRLVQVVGNWARGDASARSGGMFWYRSFLFLAIAAAFATATGTRKLVQFENGPLALSVGALPIYRVTRHAHPAVHREMAKLLRALTGETMEISNPALKLTKAEAISALRKAVPAKDFKKLLETSETCWYLKSTAIVAGGKRKDNGQPCGACVPCLVRRAALKDGEEVSAGVDFTRKSSNIAKDPVVRVHFEAYSAFADKLLSRKYSLHQFIEDCPEVTQEVLREATLMTETEAFELYKRFAREWKNVFG